jgi:hypothetical protein
MLKYTDITQNTYIQSWTVTEIMAREFWNFDSCYTLTDYRIHIKKKSSSSQISSHSVLQGPSGSSDRLHAVASNRIPIWFVSIPVDINMLVTRGVYTN